MTGRWARLAAVLLFLLVAAAMARILLTANPADLAPLRKARAGPVAAGATLFLAAFLTRAFRLNVLLPPGERLPLLRAWGLQAWMALLVQVLPMRSGDVAGWAAVRAALGASWGRAAGIFALGKVLDVGSMVLLGIAGVLSIAAPGRQVVAWAGLVAAGGLVFVALPYWAEPLSARLRTWRAVERHERVAGFLSGFEEGLSLAHDRPMAYLAALGGAAAFWACHLTAMRWILSGINLEVTYPAVAVATFAALVSAALLLAPLGTFGAQEGGWVLGLAAAGVPLAPATASALVVRVVGLISLAAFSVVLRPWNHKNN